MCGIVLYQERFALYLELFARASKISVCTKTEHIQYRWNDTVTAFSSNTNPAQRVTQVGAGAGVGTSRGHVFPVRYSYYWWNEPFYYR